MGSVRPDSNQKRDQYYYHQLSVQPQLNQTIRAHIVVGGMVWLLCLTDTTRRSSSYTLSNDLARSTLRVDHSFTSSHCLLSPLTLLVNYDYQVNILQRICRNSFFFNHPRRAQQSVGLLIVLFSRDIFKHINLYLLYLHFDKEKVYILLPAGAPSPLDKFSNSPRVAWILRSCLICSHSYSF